MSVKSRTTYRRFRSQSGITLIELLVVLAMSTVIAISLSDAYGTSLKIQEMNEAQRATTDETQKMENELTSVIEGARLSGITGDTTSYFQGLSDGGQSAGGSDRITLTTTAPGVPMTSMEDTTDFLTQQTARGPVGGLSEISIGLTPVGEAPDTNGLFERIQTPSDSDPTQGGMEENLDPNIASIGFEFWDGTEWETSWDTTQMTPPRLPEAVQVTYTITGESGSPEHVFVVPIFASDVTPNNPVTSTSVSSSGAAQ